MKKLYYFFISRTAFQKLVIVTASLFTLIFLFAIGIVFLVWLNALGKLPDKEELLAVKNPVASEVYSADSILLGRYFVQERSDITYNDIPIHVVDALIATEDNRFLEHHGVDKRSLGRVLIKSLLFQNESSGGGSTITQQLAKNLYPRKRYWMFSLVINKVREVIIAKRIEDVYDKKNILTLYLNTIPFGDNTFGIETAAQRFFSVPTAHLSIQQGAVLIGMLKATYTYNPRISPQKSKQRRNVVLAQMAKYKKITAHSADSIQALPLTLAYHKITHHTGLAPYFREYLREELTTWCSEHVKKNGKPYDLYTDGLKVYTTIDSRIQRYAEEALSEQMTALQKKFTIQNTTLRSLKKKSFFSDLIKNSQRYKSLQQQGYTTAQIDSVMNTPIAMTVFSWQGEQDVTMSPADSIQYYVSFLNASFVAVDPMQGAIKAWVGGINHYYFQYDHIRESTKRQVGSTFKPIVYAAALQNGSDPCQFISAAKTIYSDKDAWAPENGEDNYDLKYSMEGALAFSVNTVSVKVLEAAGINNTINLAHSMGIASELPAVPSIALGTANISMIEMVTAYACIANAGKPVKPFYVTTIAAHDGKLLEAFKPLPSHSQALNKDYAQMIVQMMKRTVNEGTGARLRTTYGLKNDIAGKTGTTQSNTDGWFMAITPHLVMGAWVGADNPQLHFRTTAMGQGAATALPIVGKVLQKANDDKTLNYFTHATFPAPSAAIERKLDCALYKSDETFLEKIFGKKEKGHTKVFGEKKKKGFLKRLFGKD